VAYGREGYPCAPNLAQGWKKSFERNKKLFTEPEFQGWFKTFAPEDKPYGPGDLVRLPDHADTLERIGATDAADFYTGDLARKIDAESRKYGGYLRYEDLAAYQPEWVEPISVAGLSSTACFTA
jgi:gamma-glutamyltranspeptidase/glutathione hydrolase